MARSKVIVRKNDIVDAFIEIDYSVDSMKGYVTLVRTDAESEHGAFAKYCHGRGIRHLHPTSRK